MSVRIGSLFAGYGGLEMGIQAVLGGHVAWHSEIDPAASRVLARHWPGVPNLGDITAVDWATVEPVDVVTAGYPGGGVTTFGRQRLSARTTYSVTEMPSAAAHSCACRHTSSGMRMERTGVCDSRPTSHRRLDGAAEGARARREATLDGVGHRADAPPDLGHGGVGIGLAEPVAQAGHPDRGQAGDGLDVGDDGEVGVRVDRQCHDTNIARVGTRVNTCEVAR